MAEVAEVVDRAFRLRRRSCRRGVDRCDPRLRSRRGGLAGRLRAGPADAGPTGGCPTTPPPGCSRRRATARSTDCAAIRSAATRSRRAAQIADLQALGDDMHEIPDDRLRLLFTCCHPALALDARVALTLRTVAGLTTREIARAFLVPEPTVGAALAAGQAQDPRGRDPLSGAAARAPARAARGRARRRVPGLQRGLRGDRGRAVARPTCATRRSACAACSIDLLPDEPETLGPAGADAPATCATRRAHRCRRRARRCSRIRTARDGTTP